MNRVRMRTRLLQKPTDGRLLCVVVLFFTCSASAQEGPQPGTLTEQELVRRVLARPALAQLTQGRVAAQRGGARAAGAYPNPQLTYSREQTYNQSGSGEDYVSIAQTFDVGGRRRLEREAGEARARAAEQSADLTRLSAAADARTLFYQCRHRETRVQALEGWLVHIENALALVARREARGDAATYDTRRLERERGVARARLELEKAQLGAARERLAVLAELPAAELATSGSLLPETPGDATAGSRPALRVLEQEIEAARLSAQAAGRAWVPDLRLEAGYKGVGLHAGGRTDGFLAGASLALPLWDHGAGRREASEGEVRERGAELELLELDLRAEIAALTSEARLTRAAAVSFRAESTRVSADLVRITSAGYEGGELGLSELLEAFRGAAEDELTALDMELAARRAVIELDRLTARGLP